MTTFAQDVRLGPAHDLSLERRGMPQFLAQVITCLRAEFVEDKRDEIVVAVMHSWSVLRFFGLDRDPDAHTLTATLARSEIVQRLAVGTRPPALEGSVRAAGQAS